MSHSSPAASRCTSPETRPTEQPVLGSRPRAPSFAAEWEVLDADQTILPSGTGEEGALMRPPPAPTAKVVEQKPEELHEGWDDEETWDTQDSHIVVKA